MMPLFYRFHFKNMFICPIESDQLSMLCDMNCEYAGSNSSNAIYSFLIPLSGCVSLPFPLKDLLRTSYSEKKKKTSFYKIKTKKIIIIDLTLFKIKYD